MALFGVLQPKNDHGKSDALAAVCAAVDTQIAFSKIVKKWSEQWALYTPTKIDIGLGCGIHTGEVLVGNVGTDFRDQFTALGPHVNFAARIQGRAERGQVVLSKSTEARLKQQVPLTSAGEIGDVKNISGIFPLFSVDVDKFLREREASLQSKT